MPSMNHSQFSINIMDTHNRPGVLHTAPLEQRYICGKKSEQVPVVGGNRAFTLDVAKPIRITVKIVETLPMGGRPSLGRNRSI